MDIGLTRRVGFLLAWGLAWVLAATLLAQEAPYRVQVVNGAGTVRGRVVYAGVPPTPERLPVTADYACCGRVPKWSESLIVGAGAGLANCILHIDDIRSGKDFPASIIGASVEQKDCVFIPHVAIARSQGTVRVVNSDPIFHNVHAHQCGLMYTVFNVAMPTQGGEVHCALPMSGPIVLTCDAGHRWMLSYVWAAASPYVARTAADGRFSIDGVPPGPHVLKVWHEVLGEMELGLDVPPSGTMEVLIDGMRGRKPRLAVAAGPALVPRDKLAADLFGPRVPQRPSPAAVEAVLPAPVAISPATTPTPSTVASASAKAGQVPDHPGSGTPAPERTTSTPPGTTYSLRNVAGGLALALIGLIGVWRHRRKASVR